MKPAAIAAQALEARRFLPRLGIAGPDQIGAGRDDALRPAPGRARVLASVIRILRNFGSQVISRSCRSSAMFGVSFSGNRDQRGLSGPVEIGDDAHARRRRRAVAMQMRDDDGPAIELDEAEPPRHALAKEQFVAVMQQSFPKQARPRRPGRANRADATGRRGRLRAADTAPCRNRGRLAARSGRAPPPRSGRARRGCARPAAASAGACAGSGFCAAAAPMAASLTHFPAARMAAPLHRPRS